MDRSDLFHQYLILFLLNGGALLWAMSETVASETNRPPGRHWRHVCWQASVKTQPAGSCTVVPYLLKHRRGTMNGGLFSLHVKRTVSLPDPALIESWLQWGLFKTTGILIALGYFVWAGGLTQPARESSKDVFTQDKCVFAVRTRLFQTAKGSQERP